MLPNILIVNKNNRILLLFLIGFSQISYGQNWYENTTTSVDTSNWVYIRSRIRTETMLLKISPSAEHFYIRGKYFGQIHEWDRVIEDMNSSIELDSINPATYYCRGAARERINDLKGAYEDFSKVTQMKSDFEWGWNDRGQINIKLENFNEAESDLKKAIELKPGWTIPVFNLGLMYEAKKDPLKAIDYYNKSIKIDSTNHMAYNNIGHIYAGLKNYPLSLALYTKAIEVYPRYFNAYRNRADVKLIIGDKLGACEDLKKAADLGDQKSQTAYNETCNKK